MFISDIVPAFGTLKWQNLYLWAHRNNIHIIDLEKTLRCFKDAHEFCQAFAANKCKVLFVGTKRAAQDIIKEEAITLWYALRGSSLAGGMLTNYKTDSSVY